LATTEFVYDAFAANDAMVFKGVIGSNQVITSLPATGYSAGWTYRVADAGTYAGEYCEVGDLIIAINDGPSSGSAVVNNDWAKIEHNIDGAVYMEHGGAVGSTTQPVYVAANGRITAINTAAMVGEGFYSTYTGTDDFYIKTNIEIPTGAAYKRVSGTLLGSAASYLASISFNIYFNKSGFNTTYPCCYTDPFN
jgi:hypothetical protein